MNSSETSGLASYQQTVNQTPGLASSVWPQGANAELLLAVQIVPTNYGKQEEEPIEEKTAKSSPVFIKL